MDTLAIRIQSSDKIQLTLLALENKTTISKIVRDLILDYIEKASLERTILQ